MFPNNSMRWMVCGFLALAAVAAGQGPAIVSVENAASNVPSGLPNSAIALGSMFVIKGSNLGPATAVVANSFPLQTTLAGTSVSISIGGRTVAAILYYTLDRQVAAILPSSVFAGSATLTVTYAGGTSAPFTFNIATSNASVYTLSSTGTGAGLVVLANNTIAAANNAAHPGDAVVLYANGLGPVTFDETLPAQPGDLVTAPLEVLVGGAPATVLYHGRNPCCSSVDQINIQLPENVAGCMVPIVLRMGNLVSNTSTVPMAARGQTTCTPSANNLSSNDVTRLLARPTIAISQIALIKSTNIVSTPVPGAPPINTVTQNDSGNASFFRYPNPGPYAAASLFDLPPPGSCTVTPSNSALPAPPLSTLSLDAGDTLGVTGGSGTRVLRKTISGLNLIYEAVLDANANFLTTGQYAVRSTGGGGVGEFSAAISAPAAFTWINQSSLNNISRITPLTFNWTGGDALLGLVEMSGTSSIISNGSTLAASFSCIARTSAGTFSVPPSILLALPPTGGVPGAAQQGTLRIRSISGSSFTATGVDIGRITYETRIQQSVVFQ